MDEGWESHVSPLMMGVGMGDMEGLGDMPACGGGGHEIGSDMMSQHHQTMRSGHVELNGDMHHEMEREIGAEMGAGMREQNRGCMVSHHNDYFGQEVSLTLRKTGKMNGITPIFIQEFCYNQ
ncbi:hypothetical protein WA026_020407 [Henosepilachna vigintioctopunctata]|uniref:Uncharacterized protein n=1 Tax=Henosepilachna vigintioctopunctata TaxID=420089 RepID=A0AAW1UFC8_9CUCU